MNKKLPNYHIIIFQIRYLSAERARNNWLTAATKISPGITYLDDDDIDHLAASISSQKTICSDAFDFIFDSSNLNPENLKEVEQSQDAKDEDTEDQKHKHDNVSASKNSSLYLG